MTDKLSEIIQKIQSRISATNNRSVSLVELEVMRKKAVVLEQQARGEEALEEAAARVASSARAIGKSGVIITFEVHAIHIQDLRKALAALVEEK